MKRLLITIGLAGMVALAGCTSSPTAATSNTTSSVATTAQTPQANLPPQGAPGDQGARLQDDGTHAGGQVSGVNGSTITVIGRGNQSQDVLTTASTTFDIDGTSASLSEIKSGQFVMAEGSTDSAGAFTATAIHASASQPQGGPRNGGPPPDGTPPAQP